MTLLGTQPDPGTEQEARDHGTESGGQDDRVTQGPPTQEHSGGTLSCSVGRLSTQPGHVGRL
jgi:hypothetical protein